ncbi:MAG: hypothetical protein ASARMPRED_006901 [Alectoria sarmentosa]|nr:MAG: hypothetical protein ASARMPRED_006901 [Alectoria sarmentosa]
MGELWSTDPATALALPWDNCKGNFESGSFETPAQPMAKFAAVFLKKNPQPSYVVSCRNMEWYYALEVRMLFNDNDPEQERLFSQTKCPFFESYLEYKFDAIPFQEELGKLEKTYFQRRAHGTSEQKLKGAILMKDSKVEILVLDVGSSRVMPSYRKLAAEKQASTEDVEDISQTESRLAVVVQDLAEGIENVSMSADRGRRMVSGVGLKVDVDMDDGSSGVCSGKEIWSGIDSKNVATFQERPAVL